MNYPKNSRMEHFRNRRRRSDLSGGAIAGIVIGAVAFTVLIAGLGTGIVKEVSKWKVN